MIQFIKKKFLGYKSKPRTNSVEVKSKIKDVIVMDKRPLSIDSKEKLQKTAQKNANNNRPMEFFEQDDMQTVKRYSPKRSKMHGNNHQEYDQVSDLEYIPNGQQKPNQVQKTQTTDLLKGIREELPQSLLFFNKNDDENTKFLANKSQLYLSIKEKNDKRHKKCLVQRKRSTNNIRKVLLTCSFCMQPLKIGQSIQLACTHRLHKYCQKQMKWAMNYKCNLCESKNDFKKVSVMLIQHKKKVKDTAQSMLKIE